MFPRLIALSLILAAGCFFGITATSRAQETGSTENTTTVLPGTTTNVVPTTPPPDMGFWEFRSRRTYLRGKTNDIRYSKGYHKVHKFRLWHREVKPWNRKENLAYWRSKVDQAQGFHIRGWHGHRWSHYDKDFHRALRLTVGTIGGSYDHLHSCGHSEGSDAMVWNRAGSGAFGPMQFMRSTFYGNVDGAFEVARQRGARKLPSRYKRWDSNIGQAMTAGWMFLKDPSASAWTGANC